MFINNFDPVALEIFSLEIRWYSLAYIFGIILGWIIAKKLFIQDIEVKNKFEISLSKKNTNLFIIIDDDGPGIPKNEYENVFKPFYKIDKGRADSKSSVGLGLSISSDIIKSHGGNIMLEKSKMDGLRVKVFLPV